MDAHKGRTVALPNPSLFSPLHSSVAVSSSVCSRGFHPHTEILIARQKREKTVKIRFATINIKFLSLQMHLAPCTYSRRRYVLCDFVHFHPYYRHLDVSLLVDVRIVVRSTMPKHLLCMRFLGWTANDSQTTSPTD